MLRSPVLLLSAEVCVDRWELVLTAGPETTPTTPLVCNNTIAVMHNCCCGCETYAAVRHETLNDSGRCLAAAYKDECGVKQ
jgi:hypothetical protein